MRIAEAVESGGGALGVRTHLLKVQPVPDVKRVVKADTLRDSIDTIARGSPDGILGPISGLLSSNVVEKGAFARTQDPRLRLLVIEHDRGEVAVETIVEVEHVALLAAVGHHDGAARDDVAGERERGGDVVAAWLANDGDVAWHVLIEGVAQDGGHGFEALAHEAAPDVEGVEGKAVCGGLVEDEAGVLDGSPVGERVGGTGTHVEAHSDHVETKLFGKREETVGGVHGGSKLEAQSAQAGRVIGRDTEKEVSSRVELLDFVQLISIVKGHLLDVLTGGVANIRVRLARLSVDDAARIDISLDDLLDLRLGSTVKSRAESC